MGLKKLKSFHSKAESKDTTKDKELVRQYQKAIADKLQDPALAKKAALIIEQMLKEELKK